VPVDDGHAVARGRDADGLVRAEVERGRIGREAAEDLGRLPLDLLLLAADVGHDVVEDVEGGNAGVAAAGDGLHRGAEDGLKRPEGVFEGFERHDEAGGGAVGVGDDEAFGEVELLLLVWHYVEMGRVDQRHYERHERVPPVVLRVGKDGQVGGSKGFLCRNVY
jgi:hypothetical protein